MATTTKKNRVVNFKSSEGGKNMRANPIDFRLEITPEKELGQITAHDSEGTEYVVSLGLFSKKHKHTLCCCKRKNRKILCVQLPAGQKCSCHN